MRKSFKYFSYKRPNGLVRLPMIPIILIGNNDLRFETMALLDSGADSTCITQDIAEVLGLDLSGKKEPMGGITGETKCARSKVLVSINQTRFNYKKNIEVFIIPNQEAMPVIIGREPFFSDFVITFDNYRQEVNLIKNQKQVKY